MRFFFAFMIWCLSGPAFGQDLFVDSLKKELSKTLPDTSRILTEAMIAERYAFYDTDSTLSYGRKALEAAQTIHFLYGQFQAYRALFYHYANVGEYPEALQTQTNSLHVAEQMQNRKLQCLARAQMQIGFINRIMGHYREAIDNSNLALAYEESEGLNILPIIHTYVNLTTCYLRLKLPDSARWVFNTMIDKCTTFLGLKKSDSTLWKIREFLPPDAQYSWALAFAQQGDLKEALGEHQLAETSYKEGLKNYFSYPQHDNQYYLMRLYINLASLYDKMGKPDSCIRYASQAYQTSQRNNFLDYELRASKILADAYETKKAPDSVVKYLRRTIATNDSIFSQTRLRQFQSIGFAEEQRQKEIETAKERFKSQLRFYGVLGALGVFLLIAFILYRNNRQKQKANVLLSKQKIDIENAMDSLKTTQKQLIQAEKMASLGELTAGIAHEIQNPLNFVNNFSEVNTELFDEMQKEFRDGKPTEAFEIANDIRQNLEKISQHGKRADAIVKGMLMHSRISTGLKEPTDLNALADEYLRISFHGMRAKNKSFNCEIQTNLDPAIGMVNLVHQDMGRVFMNLFNNSFYSLTEKKNKLDGQFNPVVAVTTKRTGDQVHINIRDNGLGIPQSIIEKIYQPFFTTKPTGQGTGLGLSLSYDIVTIEHGGELTVHSIDGEYTEFIVSLPT